MYNIYKSKKNAFIWLSTKYKYIYDEIGVLDLIL